MTHEVVEHGRRFHALIAVSLLLTLASLTSGCTAVGYGIGAIVDSGKPKQVEVPKSQWLAIKPGQSVIIARKGDTSQAKFEFIAVIRDTNVAAARQTGADLGAVPISLRLGSAIYKEQRPGRWIWVHDTLNVATDDIGALYARRARHGRLYGALAGLAVDAGIMIAIALTWDDAWGSWGNGGGGGW